jgi:hypothetical protein
MPYVCTQMAFYGGVWSQVTSCAGMLCIYMHMHTSHGTRHSQEVLAGGSICDIRCVVSTPPVASKNSAAPAAVIAAASDVTFTPPFRNPLPSLVVSHAPRMLRSQLRPPRCEVYLDAPLRKPTYQGCHACCGQRLATHLWRLAVRIQVQKMPNSRICMGSR